MNKRIKIWNDSPSSSQLEEVAEIIEKGGIAVIPTDSVYAVVCDALNPKSIDKLCRFHGINPDKNNLSIICSGISMASRYAGIEDESYRVIKDNTPGPFTFILRSSSNLPKAFKGRKMVGIRIPDCRFATGLAETLGHPLMTTSITFEDDDSARNIDLIAENHSAIADVIVEGEEGDTAYSTIVDFTSGEPEIVRQGKGELK